MRYHRWQQRQSGDECPRGELIGIAFDGNYEALTGDWEFIPELQRTISVDIRYVLFVTEKFAGGDYILKEMGIK